MKNESTVGKEIYNGFKMYEKVMDCILPKHEVDPNSDKNIGDKTNETPENDNDTVSWLNKILYEIMS